MKKIGSSRKILFIAIAVITASIAFAQNTSGTVLLTESEYALQPDADFTTLIQQSSVPQVPSNQFCAIVNLICPTPGNQGSLGSCTGWAVAYGAMSILAYDKYDRNMDKAKRSPSFLFNQVYASGNFRASNALKIASENGACSWDMMPYTESHNQQLTEEQKFDGGLNTITYGKIPRNNVDSFRTALYYGYPIVITFTSTQSFHDMWNSDAVWRRNVPEPMNMEGHACCVVGYDDSKQMFKVMNSWGPNNVNEGYFWMTYDIVRSGVIKEAYVVSEINPCKEPNLTGYDIICDEVTYTFNNYPAGATTTWSQPIHLTPSRGKLSIAASGNNYVSIERKDTPRLGKYTGQAKIQGKITLANNVSKTFSRTVEAKTPDKPVLPTYLAASKIGQTRTFTESKYTGVVDVHFLKWTMTLPSGGKQDIGTGHSVTYTPMVMGNYTVTVEYLMGCGDTRSASVTFVVVPDVVISYKNPTKNTLDLAVYENVLQNQGGEQTMMFCDESIENETIRQPYTGAYRIEIASEMNGIVRTFDVDENNPQKQLQLNGLSDGTYFIRLFVENELISVSQLVIK